MVYCFDIWRNGQPEKLTQVQMCLVASNQLLTTIIVLYETFTTFPKILLNLLLESFSAFTLFRIGYLFARVKKYFVARLKWSNSQKIKLKISKTVSIYMIERDPRNHRVTTASTYHGSLWDDSVDSRWQNWWRKIIFQSSRWFDSWLRF